MTQDEIIEMARQSGLPSIGSVMTEALQHFAKLVAAKEREACVELIPPQYYELRDRIRARGEA